MERELVECLELAVCIHLPADAEGWAVVGEPKDFMSRFTNDRWTIQTGLLQRTGVLITTLLWIRSEWYDNDNMRGWYIYLHIILTPNKRRAHFSLYYYLLDVSDMHHSPLPLLLFWSDASLRWNIRLDAWLVHHDGMVTATRISVYVQECIDLQC